MMRAVIVTMAAWAVIACRLDEARPAPLDAAHEACTYCRMVVSDARFAAQIVAPHEDAKFFDDLGCLAKYLEQTRSLPEGARMFVADHRTRVWVAASAALYVRADRVSAPMGSRFLAYASEASRDADPDAGGATAVDALAVFGSAPLKGGGQ